MHWEKPTSEPASKHKQPEEKAATTKENTGKEVNFPPLPSFASHNETQQRAYPNPYCDKHASELRLQNGLSPQTLLIFS
jgi:hypothetical protein